MTERFSTNDHGDEAAARRARDARARLLRAHGVTVKSKRWDFTDLARAVVYTLEYDPPTCRCVAGPGFLKTKYGGHHGDGCPLRLVGRG